eukprot:6472709-Amphidinium_carterae.3
MHQHAQLAIHGVRIRNNLGNSQSVIPNLILNAFRNNLGNSQSVIPHLILNAFRFTELDSEVTSNSQSLIPKSCKGSAPNCQSTPKFVKTKHMPNLRHQPKQRSKNETTESNADDQRFQTRKQNP